jgi:hypothetical protein
VNWADVIAQVDAGITADFAPIGSPTGLSDSYKQVAARVRAVPGDYMRGGYWLVGPSDSTDGWKNWVATPVANRVAFTMRTQDRRIMARVVRQLPARTSTTARISPSSTRRVERTFRRFTTTRGTARGRRTTTDRSSRSGAPRWTCSKQRHSFDSIARPKLLPLINKTRVANGKLPAIDINGPPDVAGCVPRKTTGACGGLWDALRYEKRIEGAGVDGQVAYWDARGWNTLAKNSFIQFPLPALELEIQRQPIYTYGGGGPGSAPDPTWDKCPAGVNLARCS